MPVPHMPGILPLCLIFLLLLAGCTPGTPVAKNPPLYSQVKLSSVDHWDTIANEVAMRVQKSLEDRPDIIAKPLQIKAPNDRPFTRVFQNLLRTRLVSKGMQVVERPSPDALTLEYDVQTVLHASSASDWLPSLRDMGIGLVGAITGTYTSASDHEIIINSKMAYNNRYVMHLSHIAYIKDADWPMYISPASFDPKATSTRTVRITNR